MSRVFDFVEKWVAETEQKRDSGVGERKSQKPEEGSALEDILKQDFGQLNEDRLYRNMDRLREPDFVNGTVEVGVMSGGVWLFA
jgi:hypothetical protein